MVTGGTLVFTDIETIGLDPSGPIRQIAAIAVNHDLDELESFEAKIKVDWRGVHLWQANRRRRPPRPLPVEELGAARQFAAFLLRHATTDLPLASGAMLRVAQLAAHQASHDGPFLQSFFERNQSFYPGDFRMLCTVQRAIWYFHEHKALVPPSDYKLTTLCRYFGVPLRDEDAHDALNDVRATVSLYRAIRKRGPWIPTRRDPTCKLGPIVSAQNDP